MQKKIKIIIFFGILLGITTGTACSPKTNCPVEIVEINYFKRNETMEKVEFYVDWINKGNKEIEYVTFSITSIRENGSPLLFNNDEEYLHFRTYERDSISTEYHNITKLFASHLLEEAVFFTTSIHKVGFSDGTMWKAKGQTSAVESKINGKVIEHEMPVVLTEANFYKESEDSKSIYFNLDWFNALKDKHIISVEYAIMAQKSDNDYILLHDGKQERIVEDCDVNVLPLCENIEYKFKMDESYSMEVREATQFTICVYRVIDSTGAIWENPERTGVISTIFLGNKGYAFGEYAEYSAVYELIDNLGIAFDKNGIVIKTKPQVFVRDKNYCVLRYDDFDIRAELSDSNEIMSEMVSFVYWFPLEGLEEKEWDIIWTYAENLRLSIVPSVLTEIPYNEAIAKINDYNKNDKSYIDFEDTEYDTFEETTRAYGKQGEEVGRLYFGVGKNMYYPGNVLNWAKDSPYEFQQNLTVEKRPQVIE